MTCASRSEWALWPNRLSAGRIVAAGVLPLTFLLFDRAVAEAAAFGLFVAASLTDFFDGWLARRLGQTSKLGAMLDSMADKALLFATLGALCLTRFDDAPWFWAASAAVALREIGVTLLRRWKGRQGGLSVSLAAKWKTVFQMSGAAALLAIGPAGRWLGPEAERAVFGLGAALFLIGVWLGLTSGYGYLRRALIAQ